MRRLRTLLLSVIVLAAAAAPIALGPAATAAPATRSFGRVPLDDVLRAAEREHRCGLSTNQLAALMLAPVFPETGAPKSKSPSPMTLSRWDAQKALHSFGTVRGQPRAFWHPGIGLWQLDTAGLGAPLTAAQSITTSVAAARVADVMADRWCAKPRLAHVWAPWSACVTSCRAIYEAIYRPGTDTLVGVERDAQVTRRGGMTRHRCTGPGAPAPVTCWRVDPARAQGHAAFNAPGYGPAPISAPFYVYAAGGREYRHWRRADTGHRRGVWASRRLGEDARDSLTWRLGEPLVIDAPV